MSPRTIAIVVEDPSHPDGRRVARFASLPILIGRADACDVVIDRPTVSRRHASIVEENGDLFVVDENSRTGVLRRDGTRISEPTRLLDMAWTIELGSVTVVISEETNADTVLAYDTTPPAGRPSVRTDNGTVMLLGSTRVGGTVGYRENREEMGARAIEAALINLEHDNETLVDAIAPLVASFRTALVNEICTAPTALRMELCKAIVERYPMVSAIPEIGSTLDQLAKVPVAHHATPVALQALEALSELAKVLDATDAPLTTVADVRTFASNVRAVVDELSIGFATAFDQAVRADKGQTLSEPLRDRLLSTGYELRRALFSSPRTPEYQRVSARQARDRMVELVIHLTTQCNDAADTLAQATGALAELAPKRVEDAALAKGGLFGRWRVWPEYKRRYGEVVSNETPTRPIPRQPVFSPNLLRAGESSGDAVTSSA